MQACCSSLIRGMADLLWSLVSFHLMRTSFVLMNSFFLILLFAHAAFLLAQEEVKIAQEEVKIAVVNDIAGHFEVLGSVLHVLLSMDLSPHVYYVGRVDAPDSLGLDAWISQASTTLTSAPKGSITWHPTRQMSAESDMRAKTLMCISAELAPKICQEMVARLQPQVLLLWVHRADTATATSKILQLHSKTELLALAPHVASLAQTRMKRLVRWAVPIAPFIPLAPASSCTTKACLIQGGFAVQGALRRFRNKTYSGFTRTYHDLWKRMAEEVTKDPLRARATVHVLGKGGLRESLGIPKSIDKDVVYGERLPYLEFWARMHNALAIIPAFGSPIYYESRISSTILASIITSTPLIAEQRLIDTYTFLKPEHIFLRESGEDEVAAMYRIMDRMTESEIFNKKKALAKLAKELVGSSSQLMSNLIQ